MMAKAVGRVLAEQPDANAILRYHRIYLRQHVDVFFQVAFEGGEDLSGVKVSQADQKSVADIARELAEKAERIRARRDPQFEQSKSTVEKLPAFLLRPTLRFFSWLSNDRGVSVASLKLPADQFGSAMVTSVGMFGIDVGYAPVFPLAGTPLSGCE